MPVIGTDSDALQHVGFTVRSLDRATRFYSLLLGVEPTMRRVYREPYISELVGYADCVMEAAFYSIPRSGVVLELIEYRHPGGVRVDQETYCIGNAHLCLIVRDISAEYQRLRAHNVAFRSPPVDVPEDLDGDPGSGGKTLYLRDPDGITIELLEL